MSENGNNFLKTLEEITNNAYIVPAYQRGYRWRTSNVEALLNDLLDFFKENKDNDSYYLLQPIIVKQKEEDTYTLIDGQQRLTTLCLILKKLGIKPDSFNILYETRTDSKNFLNKLCGNEKNDSEKDKNPDYYYLFNACETIKKWFEAKDVEEDNEREKESEKRIKFFTKDNCFKKVKFIWYEIQDDENEVFQRINTGRNPLTSPELIRSEYLADIKAHHKKVEKAEDKDSIEVKENWKIEIDAKKLVENRVKSIQEIGLEQRNFAMEWDEIEKLFKDDDFWYFLHNVKKDFNRLEFAFVEFLKSKNLKDFDPENNKDQQGYVYNKFKEYLNIKDYQKVWNEFKDFVYTLYDWYSDKETYHLIGFLLWQGDFNIKKILDWAKDKTKEKFKKVLKEEIIKRLAKKLEISENEKDLHKLEDLTDSLNEIYYQNNNTKENNKIKFVLFLHNLIRYHNDPNNIRFPFEKFKALRSWSIEHIYARNSKDVKNELKSEQNRDKIINDLNQYFDNKLKELEKFYYNLAENERFEKIKVKFRENEYDIDLKIKGWTLDNFFEQLNIQIKPNDEEKLNFKEQIINGIENTIESNVVLNIDGLENLALIPTRLNSKLSNKVFWEKREIIIEQFSRPDKDDFFVPLATFMVFNKLYKIDDTNDFYAWYKSDAKAYFDDIVKSISEFLNLKNENNEKQQ